MQDRDNSVLRHSPQLVRKDGSGEELFFRVTPEHKEPRRNVSKLSFNDADDKLSVHSSFEVIPKAKDHGAEKK